MKYDTSGHSTSTRGLYPFSQAASVPSPRSAFFCLRKWQLCECEGPVPLIGHVASTDPRNPHPVALTVSVCHPIFTACVWCLRKMEREMSIYEPVAQFSQTAIVLVREACTPSLSRRLYRPAGQSSRSIALLQYGRVGPVPLFRASSVSTPRDALLVAIECEGPVSSRVSSAFTSRDACFCW